MGSDDDPAREALWTAPRARVKPLPSPKWWSEAFFSSWLCGETLHPESELALLRRLETHVAISPETGAALDQHLFSYDIVETLSREFEWGIACRVSAPSDSSYVDRATVGSDRRLALVEASKSDVFCLPDALRAAFAQGVAGLRAYVVSPAVFTSGWLLDNFYTKEGEYRGRLPGLDVELVLRAAFVPRPLAPSGWDMAKRRPKPSCRAVAPGSVYAFTRADGKLFYAEHAAALWLAAVGSRQDEGFGRIVPGVWNPQHSNQS